MVPAHIELHRDGELCIDWASWDDNKFQNRSIKYTYKNTNGNISRGCTELPFDILVDMVLAAKRHGELSKDNIEDIRKAFAITGFPELWAKHTSR
jgi:hypothetical protein